MYIVYKTTNMINGMTYIGYHKVDNNDNDLDPYYIGCGISINRLKSTNREKHIFREQLLNMELKILKEKYYGHLIIFRML